ncbi:MAG: polyprenyl synthetase family protein [Acidimicrobiia bacterium]|nr:polyprenyl synthetase family protein [Acidimicrobiia bacterium]MBA3801837.1 polyprenyl synthetase family protein [Acidimicrobiia bacterium]
MSAVPATSPLFSLSSMDADRERVEAAMQAAVITTDPHLTELASHLLVAGGKRLRPVMTLAAARVGGGEAGDDAVQGGVACELVHLGSLYHDDVMDDSTLRRGVETVNAKWGNLQAILAGDFLLARASEIAASLGTEVAALLARTIGWLCEGQIEELRHTYDPGRDEESYLRSIQGKTAALYGTAARIGGIVAGCERHVIEALTELGANYGMVFQIVDDILDLTATEEQLGKPAGHDLVEGVYTLPVIRTLASGLPAATELAAMLGKPLGDDERMATLDIVRRNEGIEGAVSTARRYVEAAERAGADLPASESTDALRESARALVDSVSATAT